MTASTLIVQLLNALLPGLQLPPSHPLFISNLPGPDALLAYPETSNTFLSNQTSKQHGARFQEKCMSQNHLSSHGRKGCFHTQVKRCTAPFHQCSLPKLCWYHPANCQTKFTVISSKHQLCCRRWSI